MAKSSIEKAYEILVNYSGQNNQILYYKHMHNSHKLILDDFSTKYILKNHDYVISFPNKVVKITDYYGKQLQEKYGLEFQPKKLKITKIIGEIGNSYHCYGQFRQSVPPQLMYVNKNQLLDKLFDVDYKTLEIDFAPFDQKTAHLNRKLKEHQKEGVKFLLANKKCIIADEMGLGKTSQLIVASLAGGYERILIISPASLKTTWRKEIELFANPNDITVINGSEWKDTKRFTIINYDILQKFYEVAEEPLFEIEEIKDAEGNVVETLRKPVMVKSKSTGKLVQKTVKTRNKEKIREALSKSPLFLSDFDCVIIDEAQKLSNNTSIRYKTVNDFLHKQCPKAIFLATGTPLTNRPINLYHILKLIDADVTKDYRYYVMTYCGGREMHLRDGRTILTMKDATNLDELREKIKDVYIRRLTREMNEMVDKEILTNYYDLDEVQNEKYRQLWDEYQEAQENAGNYDSESYKQLVEGMLVRQFLANEMVKHTIESVDELIEQGEKVVVITTFQDEMDRFQEYYKKRCVVYNGKMTQKSKDKAQDEFMNNPKVQVFVGQCIACGVGLSLPIARYLFFNSYSWVAADNAQASSRIHRLTQTRDCKCIYQLFTDSISQDMFEKVIYKELIMNQTIKSENEKKELK